jgi:radical SAM protein (TIGR04043 family)
MNLNELKTELLCYGAKTDLEPDRKGGAGPADAVFIEINGMEISIPTGGNYVKNSPYTLKKTNGKFMILGNNKELCLAEKTKEPEFYKKRTEDGIPYRKIFLAHGRNCIGTTVFQSCIYWNTPPGCKFCGTGLSLKTDNTIAIKTPAQIYTVAHSAIKEQYTHAVLTSGSQRQESTFFNHLSECIKVLKTLSLQVQVQVSPPENLFFLSLLKSAGTDTIAINIESFDENVLRSVAPRKAELGIKKYLETMEYAVELFGKNQVISFVLAGLGENKENIIDGAEKLASIGVYPFIVPFRPISNTPLGDMNPPSSSYLKEINLKVAKILKKYNLTYREISAGCGRCTCCSSLPDYEDR